MIQWWIKQIGIRILHDSGWDCYRVLSWGHDDVIKWKHFPHYWPFVLGIHRSPVNSPHKGQWRGALMFSLISAWTNGWVNNRDAGDLRRHRVHYDVTVMGFTVFREAQTGNQLTWLTNPTMQRFHISQCTIQNRNVYMMGYGTSALWDLWDCIFDWCYLLWVRLEVNGAYLKLHWILGNLHCIVISGDW